MAATDDPVLWLSLAAALVGLVGSVVPGLPGVPLIFLSALAYAYLTGFEVVGAAPLVLLGLFAALALVADFAATAYGARRFGASRWGTAGGALGALLGTLLGALLLGVGAIPGLILGAVAGVFAGEHLRRRRQGMTPEEESGGWRRTSRAAGGVLVGYVAGAVAQVLLAVLSLAVFAAALLV
ncbi:hypothetical protein Rxycam_00115 [Rubrobacter xylanophilus DSM 9941]|uniref:DUF456 domain-containing protein n=1 Tax=Rubrobacter xylanophilus TaxID=49319 RepID=UPI001C63EB17|nr:DUF456 domain-containing protein [Rubrobacter xylanophilus]QYJ14319.1 hypothetical protein Rxycam_00115 [Rubrobacter xylanophilus DSM 9941]